MKMLALLWHAPHTVISAGGFRRTYEIMKRLPSGMRVLALVRKPSFVEGLIGGNL